MASSRARRIAWLVGIVSVVAIAAVVQSFDGDPARLPGIQVSPPPWPAEHRHLAERLAAIGLPRLRAEGTVLHTHQHLDLFVDGRRVEVPAGIGIDEENRFIAPLHTHDATGVIHIESPAVQVFTLGEFFDVWGLRFDARCIGADCVTGDRRLTVRANGRPIEGDPRALPLTPHEEIAVVYGRVRDVPRPLPDSYDFAPGL